MRGEWAKKKKLQKLNYEPVQKETKKYKKLLPNPYNKN
jgi:hypothetical protein